MIKVVIVGGGIAGMTAGILLQKAGFTTEIFEKNAVPGGQSVSYTHLTLPTILRV